MPDDEAARGIDLAEFNALRTEINNRTTLAYALISLELAAVGAGLSVIGKYPDVLLGLAAVSSFLWLFWVDHAGAVYKLASYIALELSPRLTTSAGRTVLTWEHFLRRLNATETTARLALYGTGAAAQPARIQSTTAADYYTMLLFGLTPPLLITGYLVTFLHGPHDRPDAAIWALAAAVAALWAFAGYRFVGFRRMVEDIGRAILASAAP